MYSYWPYPPTGPCPSCGHCPHCGRGGHYHQPPAIPYAQPLWINPNTTPISNTPVTYTNT